MSVNTTSLIYTVRQASDQTIVSSTTLVDTELVIPIEANKKYNFVLFVYTSLETVDPGQKIALTAPSGCSIAAGRTGASSSSGAAIQTSFDAVWAINGGVASGENYHAIIGTISNGSTAGDFKVQFAQHTSDANDSIFKAGSFLELIETI